MPPWRRRWTNSGNTFDRVGWRVCSRCDVREPHLWQPRSASDGVARVQYNSVAVQTRYRSLAAGTGRRSTQSQPCRTTVAAKSPHATHRLCCPSTKPKRCPPYETKNPSPGKPRRPTTGAGTAVGRCPKAYRERQPKRTTQQDAAKTRSGAGRVSSLIRMPIHLGRRVNAARSFLHPAAATRPKKPTTTATQKGH